MELTINGLSAGYGKHVVLHHLNIEVRTGEIVALVGANGAGKSTLVKTISGLCPIVQGEIHLNGERITHLSVRERLLRGLVHVPEGREIFPEMTVFENLVMGAMTRPQKQTWRSVMAEIDRACERFPVLQNRLIELASNLSGGQQQALAIARGLMARPKVLMLDEPSLGLSPALVLEIFRLVSALRSEGISVLLSEQNAFQSLAIADRGYVIENGSVVAEGTGPELLASGDIAERYLGVRSADADQNYETKMEALSARLSEVLRPSNASAHSQAVR